MCGIAFASARDTLERWTIDDRLLRRALDRRGPDSFGTWQDSHAAVWSTRLALWDEGDPAQPFVGADGWVAAFNGELFNLEMLQRRVGRPGASEVEVLARGLQRYGPSFLAEIDGQFAGVVMDTRNQTAWAFRDRFGICPLYVTEAGCGVAAASGIEALEALVPGAASGWDPQRLAAVLCEWAVPPPSSPWARIDQLRPGTCLRITRGSRGATVRFAEVRGEASDDDAPLADAPLADVLRGAVRSRARTTGRIAVSVSGGIDSTTVAALGVEVGIDRSFGLVVAGESVVGERQADVARVLGLHHEVLELRPGPVFDHFVEFVRTRRVPLARLGPVGMTALAQFVRGHGYTSVLCGEGADELFCGYDSYRILAARQGQFGPPDSLDWSIFGSPEFAAGRGPTWDQAYWRNLISLRRTPGLHRSQIVNPLSAMLSPALAEAVREAQDADAARTAATGVLDDRRRHDLERLLPGYLLTVQGDHAWMDEAVEQRPPFLSNDVSAWAMSRAADRHVTAAQGKTLLRGAVTDLAADHPGLGALNFDKAAFRVDCSLWLTDPGTWSALLDAVALCPAEILDVPAVLARGRACATAGRCSEAESMVLLVAASLGVLGSMPRG